MTQMLSNQLFAKGSILIPARPLRLVLLDDSVKTQDMFWKRNLYPKDSSNEVFYLKQNSPAFLLLNQRVFGERMELDCLVNEKTRRIYLETDRFHSLFCIYPSFLSNRTNCLTDEEEWLTQYFDVRGKLFRSHWYRKPQVAYQDYQALKEKEFVVGEYKNKLTSWSRMFSYANSTTGLGRKESVVVGHAIRLRSGSRNLVFEFYHPAEKRLAFWEFNEKATPKKSSKIFFDHWNPYYSTLGTENYVTLNMKRLDPK